VQEITRRISVAIEDVPRTMHYLLSVNPKSWRAWKRAGLAVLLLCQGAVFCYSQISPGELSNAHSTLTGPGHCTDCHDAGKRPPEFKCLSCHRDIRERLQAGRGYHPALVKGDRTQSSCAKCHGEHNGKKFELVAWDAFAAKFDHTSAGYPLTGKHAQTSCRKCHQPAHISAEARTSISIKDLTRTFLGLSQKCSQCHSDPHDGQLPLDCESCHTTSGWKSDLKFDHARARFRLEGAHQKVSCDKCHFLMENKKSVIKYKGIAFEDCTPCHRDPHGGSFRDACRTCHISTASWSSPQLARTFDHSKTHYPLLGKHGAVRCAACHLNQTFAKKIAFSDCRDCHKPDPHKGQFADMAGGGKCDACHTVEGFKPSLFGAAEHNKTNFVLKARHLKVPCVKCHVSKAGMAVYRFKDTSCIACHEDIHGSQFQRDPYQNRCESCHIEEGFKPSTFTMTQHNATRFPLLSGHREVACEKCHKLNAKPVKYRFEDRSCTQCHEDPHDNQFAGRMRALLPDGTLAGCSVCHTITSWHTLEKFDHDTTRYPLVASHRGVACEKCHRPSTASGGIKSLLYGSASRQCAGCHQDPHQNEFAALKEVPQKAAVETTGKSSGCTGCHTEKSWKEIIGFDHARTDFPLEGAHQKVTCAKCHSGKQPATGMKSVRFDEAPRQCAGCHPDSHQNEFAAQKEVSQKVDAAAGSPSGCTGCHTQNSWKEIIGFDHARTDYPLEGAHRKVSCAKCHSGKQPATGMKNVRFDEAPRQCAGCHEDIHGGQFVSGSNPPDCAKCHQVQQWQPSLFNHNTQSTYKLEGAHRKVPCKECHAKTQAAGGRQTIVYKKTPRECSACHGTNSERE
jgi:hypothetical protein